MMFHNYFGNFNAFDYNQTNGRWEEHNLYNMSNDTNNNIGK